MLTSGMAQYFSEQDIQNLHMYHLGL